MTDAFPRKTPPIPAVCAERSHEPRRPQWTCQGCGRPWPCARVVDELRAYPYRREVGYRMGNALADALVELPEVDPTVLYQRFILSWRSEDWRTYGQRRGGRRAGS